MPLSKFRLPYRDDTAFALLAFCIFLLPLVFSLYSYENFESIKFSLFLILTGLSGTVFFLKQKTGVVLKKYHKYFFYLLYGFGAWALLSTFFSLDKVYAIIGFYYRYTSGLVFYACLFLFTYLLINFLDAKKLEFILKILVIDALVVALICYLQSFGWIFYGGLDVDGFFRGPSLLGNPNYSAMFLACIFPITLYFLEVAKSYKLKIYYSLVSFLILFACLLLASRGALLAIILSMVLVLVLFLVYKFPKRLFFTVLMISVLSGIFGNYFLTTSRPDAVVSIASKPDANTVTRLYAWQVSLVGVRHHPFFGSGPGNFALFFERSRPSKYASEIGVFDDAHNIFLQLAVTGGVPLLLFFIGIILIPVASGLKQLGKEKNLLSLALLGSLAAWIVSSSFNPVPIPMYELLAIFLVGLLINDFYEKEIHFSALKKYLLFVCVLLISTVGLLSLVSEHLLGFAKNEFEDANYSSSLTLASWAFKINPTNELFLLYKASDEIYLGHDKSLINKDINKIIELHKGQASTYLMASNLEDLLYLKNGAKQDLNLAIVYLKESLDADPLFADRYGQLALYYYQSGDFTSSQIYVKKNLELDDTGFSAWILQARLYQIENRKQDVIEALNKAFKINPNVTQLKVLIYLAKNLKDVRQVPIDIQAPAPAMQ